MASATGNFWAMKSFIIFIVALLSAPCLTVGGQTLSSAASGQVVLADPLKIREKGEETAQGCDIACLRQVSCQHGEVCH